MPCPTSSVSESGGSEFGLEKLLQIFCLRLVGTKADLQHVRGSLGFGCGATYPWLFLLLFTAVLAQPSLYQVLLSGRSKGTAIRFEFCQAGRFL